MITEPQQTAYDTFGRWMLTRMAADLAPAGETSSPLPAFFRALYQDLLDNPGAYAIPHEPFVIFIARQPMTPEESAQHEALKAARMRVRKVVFAYIEFLLELGKAGTPSGADLVVPRAVLDKLLAAATKKVKARSFLPALTRSGLSFSDGDPVLVSNASHPGMPAALAEFAQACARSKDFDVYLFRRCDLAALEGKTAPTFNDALQMVPPPFGDNVAATDQRLAELRFKREIFVDGGDMTYRLRYSKKNDAIVYWVRIRETFNPDLGHYLRWKLESDLTPRLFARLDQDCPSLAGLVFAGLKDCQQCYGENCMARAEVTWGAQSKPVCKEHGWNKIGFSRVDYENLWQVINTMCELV